MTTAALALAAALSTTTLRPASARGDDAPVADFLLEAADGARVSLYAEQPGRTLTVLACTSVGCPIAKLLAPRLARYEKQYRDRGVRFLGIDPNLQDSAAEIATFARDAGIEFPIVRDPLQVVIDRLQVERTTEVFVLDGEFRLVYRGAVDDQYSVGAQRPAPNNDFLLDALESALAGETIDEARTAAPGCLVGRVKQDPVDADVTFFRDVAPILWRNCVECHRPGEIGPMSLLDADEAAGWAPQIAEVVADGRMPPWHANPKYGHFRNERRLTETEKRTLALWAASGAKAGAREDAPPPPRIEDAEWSIGTPDLVVELPEVQQIPAEGVVPYRYVLVDPHLTEDTWVQAVEVKPTNVAVTHHVVTFIVAAGVPVQNALADPEAQRGGLQFAAYVPGGRPLVFADGQGRRIPKGSRLLFQQHYTPNGKAATDRTRMALRFARVPVEREVKAHAIVKFDLNIPPHDPDFTLSHTETFTQPALITGLMPHLHLRGKSFRVELEHAGGAKSIVLDVPRYDFNWQHTYAPTTPIAIAAGDKVTMTAVFDNSEGNKSNPDPGKRVRWGDQTDEEMFVAYLQLEQAVAPRGTGN